MRLAFFIFFLTLATSALGLNLKATQNGEGIYFYVMQSNTLIKVGQFDASGVFSLMGGGGTSMGSLSVSDTLSLGDGTLLAPSLTFISDATLGLYLQQPSKTITFLAPEFQFLSPVSGGASTLAVANTKTNVLTNTTADASPLFPYGITTSGEVHALGYADVAGTGTAYLPYGAETPGTLDADTLKGDTLSAHTLSGTVSITDNADIVTGKSITADAMITRWTSACVIPSALTITIPARCNVYYTDLSHDPTVTIDPTVPDGQQITWVVYSNGATRTLTIPGAKWRYGVEITSVANGTYSIYTMMTIDSGTLFVIALDQME